MKKLDYFKKRVFSIGCEANDKEKMI